MTLEAAPSEESLDNSVEKTWYATLSLQIVWLSYWKPNVAVCYTTAISKAPRSSNSYLAFSEGSFDSLRVDVAYFTVGNFASQGIIHQEFA